MSRVPRILLILLMLAVEGPSAGGGSGLRESLGRYFEGWHSYVPSATAAVSGTPEIAHLGFEAYGVERSSGPRFHQA